MSIRGSPSYSNSSEIAPNLINEEKIRSGGIFDRLHRVVTCPWCFKEGKISAEGVEALSKRIVSPNKISQRD